MSMYSMVINIGRLILSAVMMMSAAGCSNPSSRNPGKTVFRYNENVGITSLDPAFSRSQANIWACMQLFNGLVQLDDNLQVQPCIATYWEVLDSGKTYRFHLRQDVMFHDDPVFPEGKGRPVKASDFVYSLRRLGDEMLASPGLWVMNMVERNASGKINATAPDDSTLLIKLQKSFPPFLGLLCTPYCSVVPREAIEKYGQDFRTHPVGTGPFIFRMWEERTRLILWKNTRYFEKDSGRSLPFLDAVSVSFIPDKQAAFLEFVKGNLDFVSGIDASYKDDLLTREGRLKNKYHNRFRMEISPYLNTEYLGILVDSNSAGHQNPLLNKKIRQAINLGFNRRKMVKYLRNNIGTPGTAGIIPAGMPGFDSSRVRGFEYDPGRCRSLLAEAGFPGGKGLPEMVLHTTPEYQDLCEYIQGQLRESGIPVRTEVNQGAQHREMVARQKLNFFRASWIADYPDAENYLSLFYSPNFAPQGPNTTHFKNAPFDSLYERSQETWNDSLRYVLYQQMDQLLMEEAPVVVLYYDRVLRLSGNHVTGLGKNALNLLSLKKVRISR